jgi:hypothetical protein
MRRTRWMARALAAALLTAIAGLSVLADDRRYSENEIYNLAQRNGYQYGVREGRFDCRNSKRFDPKRTRAYRDGRYGYRDDYRHDGTYRDGFRNGFLAGYEDGYNDNGGRRRRDDDYDNRRNRRDDDNDDYRRSRRDDDDDRRNRRNDDDDRRNRRNDDGNRRNGRPWWDVLTGQDGVFDRRRP